MFFLTRGNWIVIGPKHPSFIVVSCGNKQISIVSTLTQMHMHAISIDTAVSDDAHSFSICNFVVYK
jgi:hypothetical protein